MSISLHTSLTPPLGLRDFLPRVALNLRVLLNSSYTPCLTFDVLCDGKRETATTDQLVDRSSDYFLVSIEGEPETVGLLTDGESLGIIMGAQRSKLEYALGAAIAITAAQMADGKIEDDWCYFGEEPECWANDLLEKLRLQTFEIPSGDIRRSSAGLILGIEGRAARTTAVNRDARPS